MKDLWINVLLERPTNTCVDGFLYIILNQKCFIPPSYFKMHLILKRLKWKTIVNDILIYKYYSIMLLLITIQKVSYTSTPQ